MNKSKKKVLIGTISIIAVLFILLLVFGKVKLPYALTGENVIGSYQCSGGQVLSISNAQLVTSTNLGGKKAIRVTYSTLPSSECLYINLNPTAVNNALSDSDKQKFQATNSILGSIKLTQEQKVYNINERTSEKFKKFIIKTTTRDWLGSCTDSKCKSDLGSTNFINSPYVGYTSNLCGSDNCCCSYFSEDGINGEFSVSESFRWIAELKIGNDAKTFNQGTLFGSVGSLAYANWAGNLVSNDNLGSITNRQAYKPYTDNQWRMTDLVWQDLLNKFNTNYNNLLGCQNSLGSGDCTSQLTSVNGYNSEFTQKTTNQLSTWVNGNNIVESASIVGNQMIINLKSAVVYPTFTIDIDANSLGIFLSQGKPEVTCPTNIPTLTSGQTKDITFGVKNIGSDIGTFTYSTTCDKGSQSLQPAPPQQISAGTTKTVTGRVGLTVPEGTETSTCTFTATAKGSLVSQDITDSCTFSYSATHQSQCTTGEKSCELGNTELWTCKSDGSYEKVKCSFGCWLNGNTYECKGEEICTDESCGLNRCTSCTDWASSLFKAKEDKCKPDSIVSFQWYNPLSYISLAGFTKHNYVCSTLFIIIAIVFIFVLLITKDLLSEKIKALRKSELAQWIVSIIISGLLAFLLYKIFWLGFVIFLAYLFLSFMLRKFKPMRRYFR